MGAGVPSFGRAKAGSCAERVYEALCALKGPSTYQEVQLKARLPMSTTRKALAQLMQAERVTCVMGRERVMLSRQKPSKILVWSPVKA